MELKRLASENPADFSRDSYRLAWISCWVLWVCHVVLLANTFPLTELFSTSPLQYIDSPFHQYQIAVATGLWEHHSLIGYDPWFAAGHIGGVNFNASAKMPALLAVIMPHLGAAVVYKLFVFFAALVSPLFIILAMRLLRASPGAVVSATAFGVLLWWISALHWYHTAGMVAFVFATYASVPYIVYAWRALTKPPTLGAVVVLSAAGTVGMFLHPLFPLPILFTVPFLVAFSWCHVQGKSIVATGLFVPLIIALLSVVWAVPSVQYAGWSEGGMSPYQKAVDASIVWREAMGRVEGNARGARIYPVLWICALWAMLFIRESHPRRVVAGFIAAAITLILFAALGATWDAIGTLQPNRLSAAAYLLLAVPAGFGVSSLAGLAHGRSGLRMAGWAFSAVLVVSGAFLLRELSNEVSARNSPHYGRAAPEVRGNGEMTKWLEGWISQYTTADARILFETSTGRIHDGAHIAGYLASVTGREFVGGPYVFMHYAGFWNGWLFGRPIDKFSVDEMREHLDLYNVGWVVAFTPESRGYFAKYPFAKLASSRGPLEIYKVERDFSYFSQGVGHVVKRELNRVSLAGVAGKEVTLKYHYVPGMRVEPSGVLQPVIKGADPVPFVKVVNPPREFAVVYSN